MAPNKKASVEKTQTTKPAKPKSVKNKPEKIKATTSKRQPVKPQAAQQTTARDYVRFPLARRIEHLIMLVSFTTLGLTGLPQKFPTSDISIFIARLFGSVEILRAVHHAAATVMMFGAGYHILLAGYQLFVERSRLSMLPGFQDAKDALQALMYNLGIKKSRPQMGRYTFEEKVEYWAFVWGAVIMGLTGFMLWNPITTSRILPAEFIPAAKAAHGAEAVLAVLAIVLWHFYGVHLKSFNKSMWTGKLSEQDMLHEHPLELADIKAGLAQRPLDPALKRKRERIYFPIAGVLAAAMLFGIYGFVRGEETSIKTIPPLVGDESVYVPQTPTPLPTSTPIAASSNDPANLTWDGAIAPVIQEKCSMCHGQAAIGGLDMSTYENLLKGGGNGPAFIAGDSANSKLVQLMEKDIHPGKVTPEELARIVDWIDQGAQEK